LSIEYSVIKTSLLKIAHVFIDTFIIEERKIDIIEFIANVPCLVGVPDFLLAEFEELLVFNNFPLDPDYPMSRNYLILSYQALSLTAIFKKLNY